MRRLREKASWLLSRSVDGGARMLPRPLTGAIFRWATRDLGVALCLHRVSSAARPAELLPGLRCTPADIDAFLEMVRPRAGRRGPFRLTLSFDDGYRDAWEYVRSRAPRYPEVEWLFFVCPDKTQKRAGFRWDLLELHGVKRVRGDDVVRAIDSELVVDGENARPELRQLAEHSLFRLARAGECRELARLPNVEIGNHTNSHFNLAKLSLDEAAREICASFASFAQIFGEARHFAFPYGCPGVHLHDAHVTLAAGQARCVLWSTEERPYLPEERRPGALLPRFPFDATRHGPAGLALWIALKSLRFRLRARSRLNAAARAPAGSASHPAMRDTAAPVAARG